MYVSSSKEDLEVFEAVTQHPTLSQYIRRLVYDGTEFLPKISKKQYVSEVYGQLRRIIEKEEDSPPNSTDPDVNKLFEEVVLKKLPLDKTLRKFRACRLIRDGHKEYKEHAVYQQESLRSGNFFEVCCFGTISSITELSARCLQDTFLDLIIVLRGFTDPKVLTVSCPGSPETGLPYNSHS